MQSDVVLEVEAPAKVSAGASAQLALTLRNRGAQPLTLYLRGREIAFDFEVRDAAGNVVWSRLHQQVIPAMVQLVELGGGARRIFRDTFRLRGNDGRALVPGRYTVTGLLLRDEPEPLRSLEVRFEITP